jgi:hypothetical protein
MPLNYPAFNEANVVDFQAKYRNFAPLIHRTDLQLWTTLNSEAAYSHMRSATVCWGYPAVAGITFLIAPILEKVKAADIDYVKKGTGAMVCCIMEANGYQKTGVKKAVPPFPYRIFSRGEVYQ